MKHYTQIKITPYGTKHTSWSIISHEILHTYVISLTTWNILHIIHITLHGTSSLSSLHTSCYNLAALNLCDCELICCNSLLQTAGLVGFYFHVYLLSWVLFLFRFVLLLFRFISWILSPWVLFL